MFIDLFNTPEGTIPVSPTDTKWQESFALIKDQVKELYDYAISEMLFIESKKPYTRTLNDLLILFFYFNLVEEQRYLDITQGNVYTDADYYEDYAFKNITRYFTCRDINIVPLLDLWGFDNDSSTEPRIGIMSISGEDNTFTIK